MTQGCKTKTWIDLTGQTFGRWTVLEFKGQAKWLCRCSCGTEKVVGGSSLRRGNSTSCGCFQREDVSRRTRTHGHKAGGKYTPEYIAWANIIARCENPKHKAYPNYGGRGITICGRWRESFESFLADVGPRPSDDNSLDRIDNDGHYEPGNVRWATISEQAKNRRERPRDEAGHFAGPVSEVKDVGTSEAVIQQQIRLGLGMEPGLVLWRNQIGTAVFEGTRARYTVPYGVGGTGGSDLIGLLTVKVERVCFDADAQACDGADVACAGHASEIARFIALEVKRPGGRVRPEQVDFINLVRAAGGFAAIVRSVEEARAAIERARRGERE